jgi:hypothetical protein
MATTTPQKTSSPITSSQAISQSNASTVLTPAQKSANEAGIRTAAATGGYGAAEMNAPTNRINGVSQTPGIPNADTTAFDAQKAASAASKITTPATAPGQIDTGQPNPNTANSSPFTGASRDQALSYLKGLGYASPDETEITSAMNTLNTQNNSAKNNRFKQGYDAAKSSGEPAPVNAGDARTGVTKHVPAPTAAPEPTVMDGLLQADPMLGQIYKNFQDYMSPQNQRASLTDTYKQMLKDSGVQELDTELLNMKNVIDGTEDDIRNEVTKAGGFATDSQVMALTNSRNKQLVKNYNTLLETRNSKQEYVSTMVGLAAQDRQAADSQFDRAMNFSMQIMSYKDKMKTNAANSYNNIIAKVGYDGLAKMTGGDPYYMSMIEDTLGLGAGGLKQLAAIPDIDQQMKKLQLENAGLQNKKLRQDLSGKSTDRELSLDEAAKYGLPVGTKMSQLNGLTISGGGEMTDAEKEVTKQNALDRQTIDSNYSRMKAITSKLKNDDGTPKTPDQLTYWDIGKLTGEEQKSLVKLSQSVQYPDRAQKGLISDDKLPLKSDNAVLSLGRWGVNQLSGGLLNNEYSPSKILESITAANNIANAPVQKTSTQSTQMGTGGNIQVVPSPDNKDTIILTDE